MALSKFQLVALLITYTLLFSCQSKMKRMQVGPSECVYRGRCRDSYECRSRCGPPEFSHETLGLCMFDYDDYEYFCCCTTNY
ncbi:Defensin-like protein 275 [Arabidopsis thaliana]